MNRTWTTWLLLDEIEDPKGDCQRGNSVSRRTLKELLIAEYTSKVITGSPYYKEGFSFQTEFTGVELLLLQLVSSSEAMIKDGIKANFVLGGIQTQCANC